MSIKTLLPSDILLSQNCLTRIFHARGYKVVNHGMQKVSLNLLGIDNWAFSNALLTHSHISNELSSMNQAFFILFYFILIAEVKLILRTLSPQLRLQAVARHPTYCSDLWKEKCSNTVFPQMLLHEKHAILPVFDFSCCHKSWFLLMFAVVWDYFSMVADMVQ